MSKLREVAIIAIALLMSTHAACGEPATTREGFLKAVAPYTFSFPRDHAAHNRYRTEWWYFTGHLQAADGRRFGYELTIFRFALAAHAPALSSGASRWHGTQLYPAHFAITDERTGRFAYYEDLAREALHQGGASEKQLDVHVHAWSVKGAMPIALHAVRGGDGIDLTAFSRKPPAVHGQGGISRKGSCPSCASHYYSYTRLFSQGVLHLGGRAFRVSGISWMDHEFGSDELESEQVGWDWFSIQLTDGREVMLYRLRRRDGSTTPQSSGSLIAKDGNVRYLPLRSFSIRERSSWVSPHTNARYPSSWVVHVNGVGDLLIDPVTADQELANASNGTTYWEGSVRIRSRAGAELGVGYVELTGYAQPLTL